MAKHKIKFEENFVYEENISLVCKDVLGKFVWFGHVFFMPCVKNRLFIPANNSGWKWVLEDRDLGLTSSGLKLLGGDITQSYIGIHYEKTDPAPYPLTMNLSIPEFIGNYVTVVTEDSGCRTKSFIHPAEEPLFIDHYKINFTDFNKNKIEFEVGSVE